MLRFSLQVMSQVELQDSFGNTVISQGCLYPLPCKSNTVRKYKLQQRLRIKAFMSSKSKSLPQLQLSYSNSKNEIYDLLSADPNSSMNEAPKIPLEKTRGLFTVSGYRQDLTPGKSFLPQMNLVNTKPIPSCSASQNILNDSLLMTSEREFSPQRATIATKRLQLKKLPSELIMDTPKNPQITQKTPEDIKQQGVKTAKSLRKVFVSSRTPSKGGRNKSKNLDGGSILSSTGRFFLLESDANRLNESKKSLPSWADMRLSNKIFLMKEQQMHEKRRSLQDIISIGCTQGQNSQGACNEEVDPKHDSRDLACNYFRISEKKSLQDLSAKLFSKSLDRAALQATREASLKKIMSPENYVLKNSLQGQLPGGKIDTGLNHLKVRKTLANSKPVQYKAEFLANKNTVWYSSKRLKRFKLNDLLDEMDIALENAIVRMNGKSQSNTFLTLNHS